MPSFFVAYSAIELHIPPKSLPILPELSRFFPLLFMPLITYREGQSITVGRPLPELIPRFRRGEEALRTMGANRCEAVPLGGVEPCRW